ncbi:MAG: hypothetical protein K6G57_07360 [Lachnospiraceae bacterium]|nr:hypothetical protein [Lachnospiraceae bacterium]
MEKEEKTSIRKKKTIDEANLIDDLLMKLVVSDPNVGADFCRVLLSVLLQKKVGEVKVMAQVELPGDNETFRGVRIDVEVEEPDIDFPDMVANVFDIEPHTKKEKGFARTMRFRQAKIDSRRMKSGDDDFSHLPNLYVISITNYDPFGQDYMLYTIYNRCKEVPMLEYDDGLCYLYFNTMGTLGGSESIKNMLNYIQDSRKNAVVDEATSEISNYVESVRSDPVRRERYMTFGEKMDLLYKEGRDEGREEGREQQLLIQIIKKLEKGKAPEQIADELEEDVARVTAICDVAKEFAPNYDINEIWDQLHAEEAE